ncbi:MAG: hypothetical protein QXM43_04505 [Desulfurococcaceae archaeon]
MIIAFGGPDGCGKTTIAKLVVKTLRKKGYPVTYAWLRYPRLLSLFPLLLSKLLGLTVEFKLNGVCKYKYHNFRRAPLLGLVYELALICDYALYRFIKVTIPKLIGFVIVIDRFLMDIAIDILTERGALTKFTYAYLSKEIRAIESKEIILADIDTLLRRRKDNICNPYLRLAVSLYTRLCKIYGVPISQNNRLEDISRIVSNVTATFNDNVRVYADVSNQFIRALFFKYKNIIYFSNFLFQGMGYMWRVELAFRLLLQTSMILLMHMCLGINILLSVFISHLVLYIPYNKLLDIRKWVEEREPNPVVIVEGLRVLANLEEKSKQCLNVYLVGSLARDPLLIFRRHIDIDVRIVPKNEFKCLLYSLLISLYLRTWAFVKAIPLDLYVKPVNDREFRNKNFAPCSIVLEKVLEGSCR